MEGVEGFDVPLDGFGETSMSLYVRPGGELGHGAGVEVGGT